MNNIKIKQGNYEGYVWMSDQPRPEIIRGTYQNELIPTQNPFIVEAQLYDVENMISYSVKYIDGEYWVNDFQLQKADFSDNTVDKLEFVPNFQGVEKLCFLQFWRPEADEFCENFEVLKPAEMVFIGFTNENRKGKL